MADLSNRRPLSSRDTAWAARVTRYLAQKRITPNQISIASIGAGALAGLFLALSAGASGAVLAGLCLILGALFCQLRLLCNLFDGMVAVEAGKGSKTGPFWNEFPDRISDIAIFAGAGLGAGQPALGFAAAAVAVLTAYTRELGANIGLPADFRGPMAKQHRMALITGAAVLAVFEPLVLSEGRVLAAALWLVVLGGAITVWRRGRGICLGLKR